MSELVVDLFEENRIWTLKLDGNVDSNTHQFMWFTNSSASLLKKLQEAQAEALRIDLTETNSFDSQGLRLLLNAHKEFSRAKLPIILKNPNVHLSRLFKIMQFDRIFEIEFDP
ncbi:MAG: STAS domain-containing protein [Anaerolineae bacterium]|nr:STAS domain-containing protein [Anaerolineae bacterium]